MIAGDRSDLAGFPRLVEEFCEHMTVGNRRFMLSYLISLGARLLPLESELINTEVHRCVQPPLQARLAVRASALG